MTKSADRKPEKYVGPDGKPKIRMVPVDKEVVKSEGGMKRIATTQANKADRMAAGGKKGLETFKKKTDEACWDSHKQVGMKKKGNKMVPNCVPKNESYSMKEKVCKSCGDTYGKPTNESCMYDAYDMAGENWCSRKEYIAAQKKNEANTYAGQRDKMKIINSKPHPAGGHIVTMQTKAGKTIKRHLKNGKVKDMKEEVEQVDEISKGMVGRYLKKVPASAAHAGDRTGTGGMGQAGASADVKKGYEKQRKKGISQFLKRQKGTDMAVDKLTGKAKVPAKEEVNEISKKTAQSYLDKTKGDDAFSGTRKANNRLKGAIHAVGIKRKKESVDEVLDTPAAMDRYHNKAKAQSDRARNSATAKIVRGNKDISKEKDVIRRREKGMDMATNVRAKQFRKAVTGKPYGEAVEEDMNPYLKHPADKLKDKHASFSRQIGDLQTKKLKGANNPSIDQEIAKYQQKLRHVKNAMKSEATTKVAKVSDSDKEKLLKLRKMMNKEKTND